MTQSKKTIDRVKALLDPVVDREGYELLEVEHLSERGRMVLRLYIDTVPPSTKDKGVSVEDCTFVSRLVGDILDVEDVVDGNYNLEVSSPGLFRPLTKPVHYDRVVGERVRVKTYEKIEGRRVFTGILENRESSTVTVVLDDGLTFKIALDDIAKANLEPQLDF